MEEQDEPQTLVYRRSWTGRITVALVHGSVESIEQTDPIVSRHVLTPEDIALAQQGGLRQLAILQQRYPCVLR